METGRKNIKNLEIEYLEYDPDWEDVEGMEACLAGIIEFTGKDIVNLEYSGHFTVKLIGTPLKTGDVIIKVNGEVVVLGYWTFEKLFGGIKE